MDEVAIGKSGLKGWRARVADLVAPPVARRSPLQEDQVKAGLGVVFLALSIAYLFGAFREIATHH